MLDRLLSTLTDVLDIREVFEHVSKVVKPVLPHDIMGVVEVNEAGDRFKLLAGAGSPSGSPPFEGTIADPDLLKRWDAVVVDDVQTHILFKKGPAIDAGMKSVVSIAIRFGGRLQAGVNFFSRNYGYFSQDDLPIARRIANYIALIMSHHRLAEEARQRQELEDHASKLDLLDQSLASITDTGQLKDLIHPVSKVIRQVLPHDGISVAVFLPDGHHARRYVFSGENILPIPELMEIPPEFHRAATELKYDLVDDTTTRSESLNVALAKMGFLSVLRMPIFLNGKFAAGVAFLSKTKSTYSLRDVQAGRRIADRLALSLEREHVAEVAKRADEANARAAQLESRVRQLTDELDARTGYRRVIGESVPWREVLKKAAQVAAVETTVLLLGESGTGKEVVARFIHRGSARRDGPFVALNCAALPDNLLESELFGYERGAFTGAVQSKPGLIEQAAGGLLFLDEVGEMALSAQAKFLRVLQEREFQRLGGTRVLKADVRVVAATNRDLHRAIEQKLFREDLYFRLNVFELRLPPLRERLDDILPLSEAFMQEIGRSIGRPPAGISREAKQALSEYHWPGNVRELRNILERAAILADGGLIVSEHLALTPAHSALRPPQAYIGSPTAADSAPTSDDLESVERAMIEKALQKARFNKSIAAKALGLTRAQLYTRLKRHGLE
ncbi:MAG TPA: sigma 54-interacting transcriptional regulator [Candidatus Sulfotelmatobacter sp.]|nr:sigma 54-interacting transcriptional regulator [Candidatus Sulfotelmatobacter sp.]